MKSPTLWGALWISENKADGLTRHLLHANCKPALFVTRARARRYIRENYGYIRKRPDLREEPHGWRMPRPVRVRVEIVEAK